MKKLTLLICLCGIFQVAFEQTLIVQEDNGRLFLAHKVVPKENWYSVGRLYNISPKELAPFNNSSLNNPLSVGQDLKIPLTEINFSQTGRKATDESLVPIYHLCQQAESLSKLSSEFKAVPVASLQAWNNLRQGTGAKAGSRLIVGYLKVKTSLSQLATSARNVMPVAEAKEPGAADETAQQTDNVLSSPKTDKKQVQSTSDNSVSTVTESKTADRRITTTSHGSGGFFIADYSESRKTANGTAGTFKSTSGWSDGKYYALMNNVQVGTIVKVIAPATQKSIYAKVLGQLPDMKESEGLTIRISNAAANELGEPEGKFSVQVRY